MSGRAISFAWTTLAGMALLAGLPACTRSQANRVPGPPRTGVPEHEVGAPAARPPTTQPAPSAKRRPGEGVPSVAAPPPTLERGIPAPIIEPPVAPEPMPAQEPPIAEEPRTPDLQTPDYVAVLERFDPSAPARVTGQAEGSRIVLDTRNVRRLRIDRQRSGTYLDRSVALQLDGQGIKWLPRSDVFEFERSPNGTWSPVEAQKPVRPLRR